MRLSVKAFAAAGAVTWGLGVLLGGLLAIWKPDWGSGFIELLGALYPGVEGVGPGAVLIATLYALVDGGIAGAFFAWVYNRFVGEATT